MVVAAHGLGVTLTHASTGDERREYTDGMGSSWVKGEDGDEFFVVLTNEGSRTVMCKVEVDGVYLGYDVVLPHNTTSPPVGVLKRGQSFSESRIISHALKFVERKRNETTEGDEEDRRFSPVGSVAVEWYTCKRDYCATEKSSDYTTTSWTGGSDRLPRTMHKKEQSQLCSEEGSTVSTLSTSQDDRLALHCGALITTTTVQYTSDFGLAVRGLLSEEETGMTTKRQRTSID